MTYIVGGNPRAGLRGDVHGYGLGYVSSLSGTADKDALKIANATKQSQAAGQLMAAQIDYDKKAAALRSQLQTQSNIAKTMGGQGVMTASQIEAEIMRRIGRRPVALTTSLIVRPAIDSLRQGGGGGGDVVFTGSGVSVGGGGPPVALIAGGIAVAGLLFVLSRR